MNTLKLNCLMLATIFLLTACEVEIGGSDKNDSDGAPLAFQVASGSQTDIFYQRTDVIQDTEDFYELLADIPSMSGVEPEFNSDTDTLVSIISNVVGCSYYPKVKSVYDEFNTIVIEVENVREKSPETCNPSAELVYSYKFVKIDKTHRPVNIMIKKEGDK